VEQSTLNDIKAGDDFLLRIWQKAITGEFLKDLYLKKNLRISLRFCIFIKNRWIIIFPTNACKLAKPVYPAFAVMKLLR
jgi:hypothetical protein